MESANGWFCWAYAVLQLMERVTAAPNSKFKIRPQIVDFMADPPADGNDGKPIVENNLVANVRHAAVAIDDHAHGRVMGNVFYAPGHARCISGDGHVEERANVCHGSWLPWPF